MKLIGIVLCDMEYLLSSSPCNDSKGEKIYVTKSKELHITCYIYVQLCSHVIYIYVEVDYMHVVVCTIPISS
jgi:hypothetical protein